MTGPSRTHAAAERAAGTTLPVLAAPVLASAPVVLLVERSGPVLRRSPRLDRNGVRFDLRLLRAAAAAFVTSHGTSRRRDKASGAGPVGPAPLACE